MSVQAIVHVLENSQQRGTPLLVLIAIANRADERGRDAWPSVATVAVMARTTERHVRRILPALVRAGELVVEAGAGPRGTNRYTIAGVGGRQLPLPIVTPDEMSPRTKRTARDDISDRKGVTPRSVNTSYGTVLDTSGARLEERASRPPTERELRAATKATVADLRAEWLEGRVAIGSDRFVDRGALRGLEQRIAAGLAAGIEARDLTAAIRKLSRLPKGSPWYVDEEAKQIALDRATADHERRKIEERADLERLHDDEALRDRGLHRPRYPGWRSTDVPRETLAGI